jgi:cAMP-specific phosphodiesterase 4
MCAMILERAELNDSDETDLSMPVAPFYGFLSAVHSSMNLYQVPYHNFYHAVDVAQSIFVFLSKYEIWNSLRPLECVSLFIAALCHDLEHPGLNNAYQINAVTSAAVIYNDNSVLENLHCARTFQLLKEPENDVLREFTGAQKKETRRIIIMTILATDMTCHFKLKDDLDSCVLNNTSVTGENAADTAASNCQIAPHGEYNLNQADRNTIMKILLHSADISNPAKPWKVSKRWSDNVVAEFFAQGDREKREGLTVSPNMDRDTTDQSQLSLNFIDFIVAPFFFALTAMFPKMKHCCDFLVQNRRRWDVFHQDHLRQKKTSTGVSKEEEERKWEIRNEAFQKSVERTIGMRARVYVCVCVCVLCIYYLLYEHIHTDIYIHIYTHTHTHTYISGWDSTSY